MAKFLDESNFIIVEVDGVDKMIDVRKIVSTKLMFVMTEILLIDGTKLFTRDKVVARGNHWVKL